MAIMDKNNNEIEINMLIKKLKATSVYLTWWWRTASTTFLKKMDKVLKDY